MGPQAARSMEGAKQRISSIQGPAFQRRDKVTGERTLATKTRTQRFRTQYSRPSSFPRVFCVSSLAIMAQPKSAVQPYTIHNTTVGDVNVFHREAGKPSDPTILLLSGFPSSSHQFRHFLPYFASNGYRVLAPDYPALGFTTAPADYMYTFDNLAKTISDWLKALKVKTFAVYVFDYGSPVGMRLATSGEFDIRALVTQNGNAYEEGLGPGIQPLLNYGNDPSSTNRDAVRSMLTPDITKYQYTVGVSDPSIIEPESYTLDTALVTRPEFADAYLKLFEDYKTNVASYPKWQEWLRQKQPPTLAIWGKNDPFFIPAGAEAFRRDVKNAEVVLVDGAHFLLETAGDFVGKTMLNFLKKAGF